MPDDLPQPGDILAGKFEVIRRVGQGGMGVVYEAQHLRLGHRVAIKTLIGEARDDDELLSRFEREARAAAKLSSPHIARIHDVDSLDDGTPFIVMELLDGNDLDVELERFGDIPFSEAVDYILQACSAMSEAHTHGIVHRDLKPSNLFLADHGASRQLKVLDFGISKILPEGDTSVTVTASSLGTPLYMSPEQIRSAKHVDGRTDVWSLGVILYELIAGQAPFDGQSATAVVAAITADTPQPLAERVTDVPEGLNDAVMRALAKKAEDRYTDVISFGLAIAPFGSDGNWAPPPNVSRPTIAITPEGRTSSPSMVSARTQEVKSTARAWETSDGTVPLRSRRWVFAAAIGALAVLGGAVWIGLGSNGGDVAPAATGREAVPSATATAKPQETHAPATGAETPATPSASSSAPAAPTPTRARPAPQPEPKATPAPPQPEPKPTGKRRPVHL